MSNPNRSVSSALRSHNRIKAIMLHTVRYAFHGTSRLAADAGLSRSAVNRLLKGKTLPLYTTLSRLVKCLEGACGRSLSHDEVISVNGRYPTMSVCALVGCQSCLPDTVYHEDGTRKAKTDDVVPGHWSGDTAEFRRLSKLIDRRTR